MFQKLVLSMACIAMVHGEAYDAEEQKSKSQAKTLHWKAAAFAGTALLAVVAGIVAISIDGGTPNHHHHKHHHDGHHKHPDKHHCVPDHHPTHHGEHCHPHEKTPCMPICPLSPITPPPCVPNNQFIGEPIL